MNSSATERFEGKRVKINGNNITTNWRDIRIAQSDNLQDKINTTKKIGNSAVKQIKATTSNYTL
jgi:hypothetical protein